MENYAIRQEVVKYTQDHIIDEAVEWLINNTYNSQCDYGTEVKLCPNLNTNVEAAAKLREHLANKAKDNVFLKHNLQREINGKTYKLIVGFNNTTPCVKCPFMDKDLLQCAFPENYERECEMFDDMHTIEYSIVDNENV